MAVVGLLQGIFYAVVGSVALSMPEVASQLGTDGASGLMLSWWALLIFPIANAIAGFLTGLIGAWIYNLLAKRVGGVHIELSK